MRISRRHAVGNWLGGSGRRWAVIGSAALAASLLAVQALPAGPAAAFDGPNGHHQFVQISTRQSPTWGAEMELHDKRGLFHEWSIGLEPDWEVGGKQTWWFTANEDAWVEIRVQSLGSDLMSNQEVRKFTFEAGAPDGHCFHVDPVGKLRYTGDSDTGGCTPD